MHFRLTSFVTVVLLVSGAIAAAAAPDVSAAATANVTLARESFEGASLGSLESEVFDLALNAATATMFSNEPETHRTSLGLFVTDDTYVGKNGYSLRLDGLDKGINDKARERAIVMHGAPYVSDAFVRANGRLRRLNSSPQDPGL